jgi:UPF0176 protein
MSFSGESVDHSAHSWSLGPIPSGYLDGVETIREWYVTSFYRFIPIREYRLTELQSTIREWMASHELMGLVLVAQEGVNGTVAGASAGIQDFKPFIQTLTGTDDIRFKDSVSNVPPFHRISVDIRREIVGLKRPDLVPYSPQNRHLSPREWHEYLDSNTEYTLIDTRNRYETRAGKFRGAIDPGIQNFSEWGSYLEEAQIPKDRPVLIYCTGGIRCEKAILEMTARGYEEVFQLRDGILGYLEEFPEGHYDGECFVFDDRVTVGPDLKPTGNFGICPGCGLTSSKKQQCVRCSVEFFLCENCESGWPQVCSKTCFDLWRRHGLNPTHAESRYRNQDSGNDAEKGNTL